MFHVILRMCFVIGSESLLVEDYIYIASSCIRSDVKAVRSRLRGKTAFLTFIQRG